MLFFFPKSLSLLFFGLVWFGSHLFNEKIFLWIQTKRFSHLAVSLLQ